MSAVEQDRLQAALAREFDADARECRVVARQATDLADSGALSADLGIDLTVDTVVSNLRDAPSESTLPQRWNWWIGAISVTHDGYDRFRIGVLG
jgi:hypothetical protein